MNKKLIYRGNSPQHEGYELSAYVLEDDEKLFVVEEIIDNQKSSVTLHINDIEEILKRYVEMLKR